MCRALCFRLNDVKLKLAARWRSGNAAVCKTATHGFDSRPGLNISVAGEAGYRFSFPGLLDNLRSHKCSSHPYEGDCSQGGNYQAVDVKSGDPGITKHTC
jgi:hypothetical protein